MASDPHDLPRIVRFAPDYELDPALAELRRAGRALRLEPIPMAILLLLIHERDRLVSRQEIADAVWGKDVHLDIDNGINTAIRKIRYVLGDDALQPRFIHTVGGRGYRFIAAVAAQLPEPSPPQGAEAPPAQLATRSAIRPPSGSKARPIARLAGLWPGRRPVALLMLILISAGAGFLALRHMRRFGASPVRIAVLPFHNLTGDSAQEYFSDGFTEEMITCLGELDPRRLAVVSHTSVMHYEHSRMTLREIGEELDVEYVLEGSIRRDPQHVRITAQLIQVRNQTHVWAREYDRSPDHPLTLEKETAQEIAAGVESTLAVATAAKRH